MKRTCKAGILACMVAVLAVGFTVAFSSNHVEFAEAEGCQHVGNHYNGYSATTTKSGVREYWVCCKCHQHFLIDTVGTWTDVATTPSITNTSDDRYIPIAKQPDDNGFIYSEDGKTITGYKGNETTVTIPEGVTNIAPDAFKDNNKLETVIVPEGVTEIGARAFQGSSIKEVVLPPTLEKIDENAFKDTGITTVTIPATCTEIASGAFSECEELHDIILEDPTMKVDSNAFYCSGTRSTWGNEEPEWKRIFVDFTEAEEQEMIKNGTLDKNWKHSYTSSPWGWGVVNKKEHYATVYYKGEWKYDQGKPLPTVMKERD